LLEGETGSGKGVLARWIHERSSRQSMPFVELSCAGLRGELLSSELFGHTRGAFTSAVADRQGLIEVADGGTLFLDEIGELDPSVQPQFLKVLEEKRYRRLGDVRERRSEFRLICASNRDLDAEIEAGRFRADLHFRINVFPVSLPPLRERHEDIPALVAHILARLGAHNAVLTPAAMKRLKEHSWPGNVRELKNAIERALLVARGASLEPEHFTWLEGVSLEPQAATPESSEADRIRQALDAHDGRVEEAAKALGMSRATLYRRLKKARAN
jgi:DNA-binding NtrC family response regulator